MPVYALGDAVPVIDPAAWLHVQAVVIGNVTIGPEASIWPCAVVRGDFGRIEIGARSSVQDGTVVHCTEIRPTRVGDECVVGHNAYLEGCTLEDEVLVGSLAAVLPGSVVGRGAVIAAGAVVIGNTEVPARARGGPRSSNRRSSPAAGGPACSGTSIWRPGTGVICGWSSPAADAGWRRRGYRRHRSPG